MARRIAAFTIGLFAILPTNVLGQLLDCPPRAESDARPFEKADVLSLAGVYGFTVMSLWEDDSGKRLTGTLELWPTDSLRRFSDPEYLRLEDSPEGYARFDYDSVIAWHEGGVDRPLSGTTDINFRDLSSPDDSARASGDPNHPLVVWQWGRLDFSPTRLGFATFDRAFTYAEVEGYSSTGFWGRWQGSLGFLALVDDQGNRLPDPNGIFCAQRHD